MERELQLEVGSIQLRGRILYILSPYKGFEAFCLLNKTYTSPRVFQVHKYTQIGVHLCAYMLLTTYQAPRIQYLKEHNTA